VHKEHRLSENVQKDIKDN